MRSFSPLIRHRVHRGSVYLLVIGMSSLVMVAALAALLVVRTQSRALSLGNDTVQAEALAQSAVEYALANLNANANWRTTYTSGVATTPIALKGGTISFKLVDEGDGNLANNATDSIRIYGIGNYGRATKVYSVQAAGTSGLTCLNAALTAGGTVEFGGATVNASGMTLASNSDIHGSIATVNANLEADGTLYPELASISGTQKSGAAVTQRDLPSASVFDYYIANGTPIPRNSIPSLTIQNVVLSPTSNPYGGATNAKGIYVIDCQNSQLLITHCRIVGTLVLLNPSNYSQIGSGRGGEDQINWVPAVANYPCLLVKTSHTVVLAWSDGAGKYLKESSAGRCNFNPPGTPYPYPDGATNTTATDDSLYSTGIFGLVYVSGNVVGNTNYPRINQLVVGGTYNALLDTVTFSYNSGYLNNPPPGFGGAGTPMPVAGTWRWEPAP